jgi:polyphenol oxidase
MTNVTVFKSSALREVKHGFFGRNGGISEGVVASLNCYPYIREKTQQIDEPSNVKRNRKIILETLELESEDVISANQVHGDNIAVIKGYVPLDFADADGIITTAPNLPIGVLTADCVPILYADIHHKIVGVAHAGWKGAFLDIHLKMIKKFKDMGASPGDIRAVIGPSIQQASYEVDQVFFDHFVSKGDRYKAYFYPSIKANHYQFDLPRLVYDDLMEMGLHSVDWVRLDTVIHEDLFFSHRRATLNSHYITGRQLSVISL